MWRDSPVFPNEYSISDTGEVYSKRKHKIIKPNHDIYGYLYYVLCLDGVRKAVKAHRLVAMAFIPNPKNMLVVKHKNRIKDDNRVDNLEWATDRGPSGRKRVRIRFYESGIETIFDSLKLASESCKVSTSKLSEVLNGKRNQRRDFYAEWHDDPT